MDQEPEECRNCSEIKVMITCYMLLFLVSTLTYCCINKESVRFNTVLCVVINATCSLESS